MELSRFEKLEEKIEELITIHTATKRKNEELLEIIARKDEDIERLSRENQEASEEKNRVSERIEALLEKIDKLGAV